jgi:FkbM family methyltransferase
MRSEAFWHYFDTEARPMLAARATTFASMFDYLDAFDRPVGILETGCVRLAGNWAGDGSSTILFDKYAEHHPGTTVYTVDIDEQATSLCRTLVSERVRIRTSDSVAFLKEFADAPPGDFPALDLLYLDSFDLNYDDVLPSALHHMKELTAVAALVRPDTLVAVDDSPFNFSGFIENNSITMTAQPKIGGKGKLIAEYAQQVRAQQRFVGYQCGWTHLGSRGAAEVLTSSFVRGVITAGRRGNFAIGIEDQFVGKALRNTGEFGIGEVELAAKFVTPSDNALVVGAHVGTIAIALARLCKHVTAIEANPWTFKFLQCNIILNDVDNIRAVHLAANDKRETLQFVMNTHNSGGSKRLPVVRDLTFFYDNPDVVDVQADSLDSCVGDRPYTLVFMDIEGSEYFALKSMQNILAATQALIVEFLPHHLSQVAGVTPEQFAETLLPHFSKLFAPSLNRSFEGPEIAQALRSMFDQGHGDAALVFTK